MTWSGGALSYHPRAKTPTRKRNKAPEDAGRQRNTQGSRGIDTRETEVPTTGEPPRGQQVPGCRPWAENGGRTGAGKINSRRRAERSAETSVRGWRVTGVGDVQVDSAPRQERIWGAGATKRCYDDKQMLMGGQ